MLLYFTKGVLIMSVKQHVKIQVELYWKTYIKLLPILLSTDILQGWL